MYGLLKGILDWCCEDGLAEKGLHDYCMALWIISF